MSARPEAAEDSLGIYRFEHAPPPLLSVSLEDLSFEYFCRICNIQDVHPDSLQSAWENVGTVTIPQLISWWGVYGLLDVATAEFDSYLYHQRRING